jgi:hypothetical protein
MENLMEEIESYKDSKLYTPESIAWDLLVGNIDKEKRGCLFEYGENEGLTKSEKITFRYEILITIFMELLFDIAKLNFYSNYTENTNKKFIPDYNNFKMDTIFSVIKEKFAILGFELYMDSENMNSFSSDKEGLKVLVDNRYCRVVLRYYDDDSHFDDNEVSDSVYYHMKLNGLNKKKYKDLLEVYSVIFLNEKVYRISFMDNGDI